MDGFGHPILFTSVYSAVVLLAVIAFFRTHLGDPGRVPIVWPWEPKMKRKVETQLPANALGVERKLNGTHRFCKYCGRFKPDRAHHCRRCGCCVLEMDHHCPWVKNCVGFKNHKFFFLLLVYGWLSCWLYVAFMAPRVVLAFQRVYSALDIIAVFGWFLAIALGSVLTLFTLFHLWLGGRAYTTIEFCEKRHAVDTRRYMDSHVKIKAVYRRSLFDRGCCRNLGHMLGNNPLFWFCPVRWGMTGDGLHFKTHDEVYTISKAGTGGSPQIADRDVHPEDRRRLDMGDAKHGLEGALDIAEYHRKRADELAKKGRAPPTRF